MSHLNDIEKKEANEAMKVLEDLEKLQKDPNINKIFFKKYKAIKKKLLKEVLVLYMKV